MAVTWLRDRARTDPLAVARLVVAAMLVGFVVVSSRSGPVVTPDGAAYLRMAQGRVPIEAPAGHFPGGYPFVLSLISRLGLTSLSAARWLGAGLAGVNVLLAG